MIAIGRVGSKGELFPPKEIRERLGLKPGARVAYRVERGALVVEPIPSLEDVLGEEPAIEVSLEELHELRRELSREVEL